MRYYYAIIYFTLIIYLFAYLVVSENIKLQMDDLTDIRSGMTVSISCTTDSANPAARIRWKVNGDNIDEDSYNIKINIKDGSFNGEVTTSPIAYVTMFTNKTTEFECFIDGQQNTKENVTFTVKGTLHLTIFFTNLISLNFSVK